MAVTLTATELRSALRLGQTTEETAEATRLLAYCTEAVSRHLGDAYDVTATPAAVVNEAVVRLAGYLFDQPNAGRGSTYANALRNSGAAAMLLPYRIHRAGVLTGDAVTATQDAIGSPGNPVIGVSLSGTTLVVTFADGATLNLALPDGSVSTWGDLPGDIPLSKLPSGPAVGTVLGIGLSSGNLELQWAALSGPFLGVLSGLPADSVSVDGAHALISSNPPALAQKQSGSWVTVYTWPMTEPAGSLTTAALSDLLETLPGDGPGKVLTLDGQGEDPFWHQPQGGITIQQVQGLITTHANDSDAHHDKTPEPATEALDGNTAVWPAAKLGTGAAGVGTFLRGDGTWASPTALAPTRQNIYEWHKDPASRSGLFLQYVGYIDLSDGQWHAQGIPYWVTSDGSTSVAIANAFDFTSVLGDDARLGGGGTSDYDDLTDKPIHRIASHALLPEADGDTDGLVYQTEDLGQRFVGEEILTAAGNRTLTLFECLAYSSGVQGQHRYRGAVDDRSGLPDPPTNADRGSVWLRRDLVDSHVAPFVTVDTSGNFQSVQTPPSGTKFYDTNGSTERTVASFAGIFHSRADAEASTRFTEEYQVAIFPDTSGGYELFFVDDDFSAGTTAETEHRFRDTAVTEHLLARLAALEAGGGSSSAGGGAEVVIRKLSSNQSFDTSGITGSTWAAPDISLSDLTVNVDDDLVAGVEYLIIVELRGQARVGSSDISGEMRMRIDHDGSVANAVVNGSQTGEILNLSNVTPNSFHYFAAFNVLTQTAAAGKIYAWKAAFSRRNNLSIHGSTAPVLNEVIMAWIPIQALGGGGGGSSIEVQRWHINIDENTYEELSTPAVWSNSCLFTAAYPEGTDREFFESGQCSVQVHTDDNAPNAALGVTGLVYWGTYDSPFETGTDERHVYAAEPTPWNISTPGFFVILEDSLIRLIVGGTTQLSASARDATEDGWYLIVSRIGPPADA